MPEAILVPARKARGVHLHPGDTLRVINTHGGQVVDTWAFPVSPLDNKLEFMSTAHTRIAHYRLFFSPNDVVYTNLWRHILTFTAQSAPHKHDTLCPACDVDSYRIFDHVEGYHDNCSDNLMSLFKEELGRELVLVPTPWNLWEKTVVEDNEMLKDYPSEAAPGAWVEVRAEMECWFAVSACPQDIIPISGEGVVPRGIELRICRSE
jgi:uncharacterized protein YcgI (DUF1989 family)